MQLFFHTRQLYAKASSQALPKLVATSAVIGFLCTIMSDSLKRITGYYENKFFTLAGQYQVLYILFPLFGFCIIYILRQNMFAKKENKGIKEIFETLKTNQNELPVYKIPSHYINGLLTVAFGGSTGIEVSTVVASATIGSVSQKKLKLRQRYKTELICAGVAAGITALFNSPLAGILFSAEVLTKKISKPFMLSTAVAVSVAWLFNELISEGPLFNLSVSTWHIHAIPYFMVLGVIAGLNSAYLTRSVMFFKKQFARFRYHHSRIIAGSLITGVALLLFPQLYGEGYHAVKEICSRSSAADFTLPLSLSLCAIILLKPVITSLTLAAGGDGGVFAPSLFMGAFLGLAVAGVLNTCFHAEVIPLNFMVVGMAAVLSSSIHAPFTAIFLVCGLIGSYALVIPILVGCLVSKLTSMMVYPYTVYNYPVSK